MRFSYHGIITEMYSLCEKVAIVSVDDNNSRTAAVSAGVGSTHYLKTRRSDRKSG